MSKSTDWLPSGRDSVLAMAGDWISVCTGRKTDWNIPDSAITELTTLRGAAAAALETAKNETTRTPVATAQCKEAFDALCAFMRDFKRRYFLTPPLADSDYIALGLKPHDTVPTPGKVPTAHVAAETFLVGRHELGIRITYADGDPKDKANKGFRIWYGLTAPGETPPAGPGELRRSFYTQRRKDLIEFEFGDSGKTASFAVQVENDGKKGPWGPLVSALIP
ncbi:MAG: hypothetical protein LBI91_05620 [Spirochaetaceae bacterium]|jgi:hypothetical protein|nr:hypothetical protein [Spirochaetaceae bacterium]